MRAVVMAGGEGTRLRPMTANLPKPLLPVANRPILEHVLRLLRRHGLTDTVITVQYLAALVRAYFGDGDELGMTLSYATETLPLGTAGSVKNAEDGLRDGPFVVLSGDALTDIDLTAMCAYHREKGALVTVALKRVPDPLEFGIVITSEDGRVQRFLEKPTWGQVFSDTINTGIYVMEPEVLDAVLPGQHADWASDVFPSLLSEGAAMYGWVADGYWEDVGTHASYLQAQVDVLAGRVQVDRSGFEVSPGVWVGEGADIDPAATLVGPLYVGDYAKVEAGAVLGEFTVLGNNVVVQGGAELHRAVVHDNVFIGPSADLRGCVIGKSSDVMRSAQIGEGVVVGDECVIEEEAILGHGVLVFPFKTIEAGAVIRQNVVWESRGQRSLFGPRGVSGLVNVEITPELCVRLASAWATTLRKGSAVTTSRDASRAARALQRAVVSALTASGIEVRDLDAATMPVTRFDVRTSVAVGGVMLRTTPGDPQSIDLAFLDADGADLSTAAQRRLERVFSRQEFRRAFPGEIAEQQYPARLVDVYSQDLLARVDTRGVQEAGLKVVLDCAGGAAALVLPALLGRLGVDVLTVNGRLDETSTTESRASHLLAMRRLGELVSSARAAFGIRFDHAGERLSLVDDCGTLIDDDRALLVLLDLVAAESRGRSVALPETTTRVAERVCRFHGVQVAWTSPSSAALTEACARPGVVFAADGRGGFVVPEFAPTMDATAAFARMLGLVARTRMTVSEIEARIPVAAMGRRTVATPWAVKGAVMRRVVELAGDRVVDTADGVRVDESHGRWVLVLPDRASAVTHLWAEGTDDGDAQSLVESWARNVERATSA